MFTSWESCCRLSAEGLNDSRVAWKMYLEFAFQFHGRETKVFRRKFARLMAKLEGVELARSLTVGVNQEKASRQVRALRVFESKNKFLLFFFFFPKSHATSIFYKVFQPIRIYLSIYALFSIECCYHVFTHLNCNIILLLSCRTWPIHPATLARQIREWEWERGPRPFPAAPDGVRRKLWTFPLKIIPRVLFGPGIYNRLNIRSDWPRFFKITMAKIKNRLCENPNVLTCMACDVYIYVSSINLFKWSWNLWKFRRIREATPRAISRTILGFSSRTGQQAQAARCVS